MGLFFAFCALVVNSTVRIECTAILVTLTGVLFFL